MARPYEEGEKRQRNNSQLIILKLLLHLYACDHLDALDVYNKTLNCNALCAYDKHSHKVNNRMHS